MNNILTQEEARLVINRRIKESFKETWRRFLKACRKSTAVKVRTFSRILLLLSLAVFSVSLVFTVSDVTNQTYHLSMTGEHELSVDWFVVYLDGAPIHRDEGTTAPFSWLAYSMWALMFSSVFFYTLRAKERKNPIITSEIIGEKSPRERAFDHWLNTNELPPAHDENKEVQV
jgi:ABC-type uncharacterized transport system fused permease/ATPase subunit